MAVISTTVRYWYRKMAILALLVELVKYMGQNSMRCTSKSTTVGCHAYAESAGVDAPRKADSEDDASP